MCRDLFLGEAIHDMPNVEEPSAAQTAVGRNAAPTAAIVPSINDLRVVFIYVVLLSSHFTSAILLRVKLANKSQLTQETFMC